MINIRLNCLANILNNKDIRATDELVKRIKVNALNAWQNHQGSENYVRFLQKMNDSLFRFLKVTQMPDGSLLVYR